MAEKVRQPPTVSEANNFRAREEFDRDVERILSLVGDATATVGSISAGARGTVTIPVSGARPDVGQTVQVGLPSTMNQALVPYAYVSASDTVVLVLYNPTGSPIVLGSATYHARVML